MTSPTVRKTKRADELVVGDRIAGEQLPLYSDGPAEVVFARVHEYDGRDRWVFVAFALGDGFHDSTSFRPEAEIQIESFADPTGLGYSREAEPDDPRPVSPGRVPLHTGAMTADGLVDETNETVHFNFVQGDTPCGLAAVTPHQGSLLWSEVNCRDCHNQAQL